MESTSQRKITCRGYYVVYYFLEVKDVLRLAEYIYAIPEYKIGLDFRAESYNLLIE